MKPQYSLMKKHQKVILLILIVTLGFSLRIFEIGDNPKGMYGDGLTLVYDAYSISKTGQDQKGEKLPIVFSLGGGRPGGYVYATIPFVAILGPTALAARTVSILSGVGIILLVFLVGELLFTYRVGLLAAFLTAVSPWDLSISRGTFETHFALFLALFGVYATLKSRKNLIWIIVAALFFSLSMLTYVSYQATIPLLIVFILLLYLPQKRTYIISKLKDWRVLIAVVIFILSVLLSSMMFLLKGDQSRISITNIFNQKDLRYTVSATVNYEKSLDRLPSSTFLLFHNAKVQILGLIAENYIGNLAPGFLFLHGDGNPLHNPPTMGELFWVEAIFVTIGILALFKDKRKIFYLILGWLLISPLPTAFTGPPHALRSTLMIPPLLLLSAYGLDAIIFKYKLRYKFFLIATLSLLFILQFLFLLDRLYAVAPNEYARFWSYPAKQAVEIAIMNRSNFDYIFLSTRIDNAEFAYPVYAKLNPQDVINQNKNPTDFNSYKFLKYGNVYVGSIPNTRLREFVKSISGSVLYIGPIDDQSFLDNYLILRNADTFPDLVISGVRSNVKLP